MLFDTECPICGRTQARGGVCPGCVTSLGPPPLLDPPDGLTACRALTGYDGTGRALVTRLKFHNHRAVLPFVAERLAGLIVDDGIDVVTWAPTAPARCRRRGYDQAALLAKRVAVVAGVPLAHCLVRLPGPPQTGRHRDERILGPRFDARRGIARTVAHRRVALVDDVATTGATLSRAAEVLHSNGAEAVIGVVVARTPNGRHR